jgi:hypothetical protein
MYIYTYYIYVYIYIFTYIYRYIFICVYTIYIYIDTYISAHLLTSHWLDFLCSLAVLPLFHFYKFITFLIISSPCFHVLLLCLLGPRKRSSGPESGPETRIRAPKDSEKAVQDSSRPKKQFGFGIYIYIYMYLFIYLYNYFQSYRIRRWRKFQK